MTENIFLSGFFVSLRFTIQTKTGLLKYGILSNLQYGIFLFKLCICVSHGFDIATFNLRASFAKSVC